MDGEFIKTLLKPLGIYELEGGSSGAEIEAVEAACGEADSQCGKLEKECVVSTAEDYGLYLYEAILPKGIVSDDMAARREALCALLSIDDTSFTQEALNRVLAGCGIPARVEETDEKYVVSVSFPGTKGVPDSIESLQKRIEDILPCHIGVVYVYVYLTWNELEEYFGTWESVRGVSWKTLEKYEPI